ncbi:hypothetical protein F8S09_16260 [Deinococcus sp. SDU3-2]|uniref:Uncharacterized protein n=1 Tax=Deinococcus terrestris TaxID=2651870 RepID=A0A7X1NYN7_9DEIO|nr:hypothetical protein [Deinococcus terrestris]MPY68210.1 hypothetical protein [Deinococcus terrestris]
MGRRLDELLTDLCPDPAHPLAPALRRWSQASPPFLKFAQAHAAKIRKKVRLASSEGEGRDLLAELAVAALLVADPRCAVGYEPPHPAGQRGPDFEVIFKGHTSLRVEVTRLRLPEDEEGDPVGTGAVRRVARVICDKIGQCAPGGANLLIIVVPPGAVREALVPAALRLLDGPVPSGLRPEDVREFQRHRQRLGAVALCSLSAEGQVLAAHLWTNPTAKHSLPPDFARFLLRATDGAGR